MTAARWSSPRTRRRIACHAGHNASVGTPQPLCSSAREPFGHGVRRIQSQPMSQLFQRKPIADLIHETEGAQSLKRTLGAGDLVMLAIGAVIGAGIFGAIGTAAAGQ